MDKSPRIMSLLAALLILASACGAPAGTPTPARNEPIAGFVVGSYAFVPHDRQVLVMDVRDPARPQTVAAWDAPGQVHRVVIDGRTALVAHRPSVESWNTASGPPDGGVQFVDIGDPLHPRPLGVYRSSDLAEGVAVSGDVAYVADWAGVSVVDVRQPAALAEIARLPQRMGGLQVTGDRLAGAWGGCSVRGHCSGGLWLADISEPRQPVELGRVDSGGLPGYDVAVVGRYAYVAGRGVWVVDLADPTRPAVVSSVRLDGGVYQADVEATEAHLFVIADGLYVYDLTHTPDLVQVAHLELENVWPSDMALADGTLYLAANGGLYIVDVRDPMHPALVGAAAATPIAPPVPSPTPVTDALEPTRMPPPTDTPAPTACDRFPDPPSRLATAIHRPAAPDPPLDTAPPHPPSPDTARDTIAYAVHTLYLDATVARLAADGGFDTAVQVFPWRDLNPEPGIYTWDAADDMVRNAQAAGLNLVVRLDMPPDWARVSASPALPFDLAAYADFVSAVAERYRGRVLGYIVWNEPNLAAEWSRSGDGSASHWYSAEGGAADPADYVSVLGVAFRRIRAADPAARVVTAGLAPTGERSPRAQDDRSFLAAMLDAGAWACFDVLSQHAYGYGQDPAQPRPTLAQPGLERVAQWRTLLQAHGVDKPVWITELGYTVGPGSQPSVTPARQAGYLTGAVTRVRAQWPWVEMLTVWNLSYGRDPGDEMAGFSLVEADAAPRPAYRRLQTLLGPSRGAVTRGRASGDAITD